VPALRWPSETADDTAWALSMPPVDRSVARLEQAVREDVLPRNVAKLVQVGVPRTRPVDPGDVEEAMQFLKAVEDDRLYALWAVAIGVGLRRGEALAFRWQDVDLEEGTLHVRQTVQRVAGKLQFSEPKTPGSRRQIPLPAVCVRALVEHRDRQLLDKEAASIAWQDPELVFTTWVGTPLEPGNVNRHFNELCVKAGLRRIRIHDLRHTCASLLLAQGRGAAGGDGDVGHSQIGITMNLYSHVMPVVQRDAADRMNALLDPVAVTAAVTDGDPADDGERFRSSAAARSEGLEPPTF
jgi:integrase